MIMMLNVDDGGRIQFCQRVEMSEVCSLSGSLDINLILVSKVYEMIIMVGVDQEEKKLMCGLMNSHERERERDREREREGKREISFLSLTS
jgi:hypothetical protein